MDLTPEQIEEVRAGFGNPTWWGARIISVCDMALQTAAAQARITQLEQALRLAREHILSAAQKVDYYGNEQVIAGIDTALEHTAQAPNKASDRASEDRGTQWIPLKERLPPDGESVLLFLPEVDRGRPGCEVAQWWSCDGDPSGKGGCFWTNGGPNAGSDMEQWTDTATHWQPLPEPPGSSVGPDAVSVPQPDGQNAVDERPAEESVPRGNGCAQ